MHIKRIYIENFQSIKKLELKFDQNSINVFEGLNDIGKSAIIRALALLFYNENYRSVNDLIRTGENYLLVEVEFYDGYIVRTKRGSTNVYELINPDGTIERFTRFSNSVPDRIKQVANFYRDPISEENLNIRMQSDPLFCIYNKPSDIYAIFQSVIKTTEIHNAISRGKKKLSFYRNSISEKQVKLEQYAEKINSIKLPSQDDIDNLIALKSNLSFYRSVLTDIKILVGLYNRLEQVEKELEELKDVESTITVIDKLKSKIEVYKEVNYIVELYNKYNIIIDHINKLKIDDETINDIVNISNQLDKLIKGLDVVNELIEFTTRYKKIKAEEVELMKQINNLEREKTNIFKILGKCPVCGSVPQGI